MQFSAANKNGTTAQPSALDDLVRQIGRLLRHPAYHRSTIVSAMLRRHLPFDGGYAWHGEALLRERLEKARLDRPTLDHLLGSVRGELLRLRRPADA